MTSFSFFWKKDKSREIRNSLREIEKKIKNLDGISKQTDAVINVITKIKANIETAKAEIKEKAQEEKSRPWIDTKFDSEIEKLADDEANALTKLSNDLDFYNDLAKELTNDAELKDVVNQLLREEELISAREKQTEKRFEQMEEETIRIRARTRRVAPITEGVTGLKTSDGVKWKNIVCVVEQLGGWTEPAGKHKMVLKFPNSQRPIPASQDVHSGIIARQIKDQLANFLPKYKIPSQAKLTVALASGDLHDAA